MTKYLHYMKDISRFMVFHCSFEMSKSVKSDFEGSLVLKFVRDFSALFYEESA